MRNPCGDGIVMYLGYINVDDIYFVHEGIIQ